MKKYITVIISAILFVALFLGTFRGGAVEDDKLKVQMVTFGDSVFGEVRDDTAIPALLEEFISFSFLTVGWFSTSVSGRRVSHTPKEK